MDKMPSHDQFFSALASVPGSKEEPFDWSKYARFGVVTNDTGYIAVLLDGETSSFRMAFAYVWFANSTPVNGARVLCLKVGGQWIVLCPVSYL